MCTALKLRENVEYLCEIVVISELVVSTIDSKLSDFLDSSDFIDSSENCKGINFASITGWFKSKYFVK